MASTEINPINDFSLSTTNLPALALEIKGTCATWGFLYLKNHGLPQATIDRMFDISATFFKTTPRPEKSLTPWNSIVHAGYDETGTEGYFNENGANDRLSAVDEKEKSNPEILNFMAGVHDKIAVPLLSCLGVGLGLSEDHLPTLHQHASPSMTTLRLIHYQPSRQQTTHPFASHRDQGVITILFQNQLAGLQVRPPKYIGPIKDDEKWLHAPVIPGAVLINIGETMTVFSGGLMKSTLHRVAQGPWPQGQGKDRFSTAYFCHPNTDTLLEVLRDLKGKDGVQAREAPVSCVTEKKVRTVKDWIEHRHSMGRLQKAN